MNYSTGFLWDLGKVALHLQDPSPQLLLLSSLETGSETPGLVGTVTQGHPTSSSCDSGLGTSPCTAASAAPWGCSSQGTDISGDFRAESSSPRSMLGAGLVLRPCSRDTHRGQDGGCRSSPAAPPFPSSPNVCTTYSCPWQIYGAAVSISPALY